MTCRCAPIVYCSVFDTECRYCICFILLLWYVIQCTVSWSQAQLDWEDYGISSIWCQNAAITATASQLVWDGWTREHQQLALGVTESIIRWVWRNCWAFSPGCSPTVLPAAFPQTPVVPGCIINRSVCLRLSCSVVLTASMISCFRELM